MRSVSYHRQTYIRRLSDKNELNRAQAVDDMLEDLGLAYREIERLRAELAALKKGKEG